MINLYEYYSVDWEATADNINSLMQCTVSKRNLAKYMGKTERTISNWCNGAAKPCLEDCILLAKIFNVNLDKLLIMKNDMKNYDSEEVREALFEILNVKSVNPHNDEDCGDYPFASEEDITSHLLIDMLNMSENIQTLNDFLLYLPLFNQRKLIDFLDRSIGNWGTNDAYIRQQLKCLYEGIPESDEKKYADRYRRYYLSTPTISCVTDDTKNEKKLEKYAEWISESGDGGRKYREKYKAFINSLIQKEGFMMI